MNLADILDAITQAETEAVTKWQALPDDVRNHHWIAKPEITTTRVQAPFWTMRDVVTGARRNWKRSKP
jgi:CDP-diacylglycerol pyrophosphatase